jgi:hypothetical protein
MHEKLLLAFYAFSCELANNNFFKEIAYFVSSTFTQSSLEWISMISRKLFMVAA